MAHALVRFCLDKEKHIVPVTDFKDGFDFKKYNPKHQYLVFFSPGKVETRESLLRKVSDVPVFESSEQLDKHQGDASGYYRATVSCAAATYEEVKNRKKRACTVPLKLLDESSFDEQKTSAEHKGQRNKTKKQIGSAGDHSAHGGNAHKPLKIVKAEVKEMNISALKKKLINMDKADKEQVLSEGQATNEPSMNEPEHHAPDIEEPAAVLIATTSTASKEAGNSSSKEESYKKVTSHDRVRKIPSLSESSSEEDDCFVSASEHKLLMEHIKRKDSELFTLREDVKKLRGDKGEKQGHEEDVLKSDIDNSDVKNDTVQECSKLVEVSEQPNATGTDEENSLQSLSPKSHLEAAGNEIEGSDKKSRIYEILKLRNVVPRDTDVDDLIRIGPGIKSDKPFVKLAAQLLWGSSHLRQHSTDGRRDPKRKEQVARPALDKDGLDVIRDLLIMRVEEESKKETYGSRCSMSRVKRIGEKIQSLMTSYARAHTK